MIRSVRRSAVGCAHPHVLTSSPALSASRNCLIGCRSSEVSSNSDPQSVAKISWLCSTINCTARFFACMSVISLSRLWSRIIVGANTTARFLGDIWDGCQFLNSAWPYPGIQADSPSSLALGWRLWPSGTSGIPECRGALAEANSPSSEDERSAQQCRRYLRSG